MAFMCTTDRKDWFPVDKDALDPKHYVEGLRGKGLTNADPKTFFPEIQYPAEGHLKSKSGTILWWTKFSKPAPKGGGGGAMFATHGGSLFCALEATPAEEERGVLVVARRTGAMPFDSQVVKMINDVAARTDQRARTLTGINDQTYFAKPHSCRR